MTRTDGMGTWESTDDGRSWTLTEPSAEFLAERAAATPPETQPSAEERLATLLAALSDAQSLEEIRQAAATAGGQ